MQEILEAAVLTDTAMSVNECGLVEVSDLESFRGEVGTSDQEHSVGREQGQEVVEASELGGMGMGARSEPVELHRDACGTSLSEPTPIVGGVPEGSVVVEDERNTSAVVDDVEMREVGDGEAALIAAEVGNTGPSSISEALSEAPSVVQDDGASGPETVRETGMEESGVEGPEGRIAAGDAVTGSANAAILEGGGSTTGQEEWRSGVSEGAAHGADGQTTSGSAAQQSG